MAIFGLTHYVEDGVSAPGYVHAFAIEECENCGGVCEAGNALGLDKQDAVRFHLTKMSHRLPEQYYSEELGGCCCQDCC